MKRLLILFLFLQLALAAFAQNSTVSFNLNYETEQAIAPVTVKTGNILPAEAKSYPVREGYRFGGWYTAPECRPEQEWRFGNNASFFVQATDSMKVEKSMTLYAKWVSPRPIRTVAELDAIREDLYGWYVLENDLDLSGIANWEPIGCYEADYEFAPAEWWRHAFKGIFDGQGHTIKGLRITELRSDKAGLFGTMADGEIRNLNMEDSRLVFTAERPYVAPLVGIIKQDKGVAAVRNCRITGTQIRVKTTNTDATFHSFTGLCGGIWGGILENNIVSGKMDIEIAGNGGGELYVGAYAGEAYNDTRNCTSDFDISIRFTQPQTGEYKAYIGGLQASATNVEDSKAAGSIRISGESGAQQLFVGGLVGSERYGIVSRCSSTVRIAVSDGGFAQVGGIVGEFNATYGAMGSAFGVTTTRVSDCTYVGTPAFERVTTPVFGEIAGAGEPAPLTSLWGPSMSYKIENCSYKSPAAQSDDLLDHFANPPREARLYVWWHWINGNTSKDGIRKDLEWMDRIGIAGLHQFDAGGAMMQGLPPVVTPTPYLSDAWKDNFAYAIALADSLGMEVGIASAPGWSSTGGPWVEPADAMKKLTWRTLEVEGGKRQTLRLPEPYRTIGKFLNADPGMYASVYEKMTPWYEDIAVVAVRMPEEERTLAELGAKVSSSGGSFTLEQLTDGDISNGAELPLDASGTHAWIQYSFPEPITIRSFTLVGGEMQDTFATARSYNNYLMYSLDGEHWETLCHIPSSPVPQLTADIPATTARYFRLMIVNPQPDYSLIYYGFPMIYPTGTRIHEWKLHTVDKVNHAEEKAGFASPVDLGEYNTPASPATDTRIVDLTSLLRSDGTLAWDVPAGRWRIYRFGASLTGKQNHPAPPEATGLEVDKLDPDAWTRYFHQYLDLYKDAAGGRLGGKGIRYLMIDSYEAEWMTWTPRMEQAFREARGYDLRTWLPALAGEILYSPEETESFLFDWRETLGELFAANYDRVNDILRDYGMAGRYTEGHESSRTFIGDGMDVKRSATIPMAAIWTSDTHTEVINTADIRESASVAHLYGQNIVAGETFTANGMYGNAFGWYPGNLKITADLALLSGLNRFFIHESTHQPSDELRPGLGLLIFGQWFSRHETWADYARYWTDYLARSCYLLQQGRFVADVLVYYGEDTNVVAEYWKEHPDVPAGYSYDFCSPHALLNHLFVRGGRAVTESGMSYKAIVLGKGARAMSPEVLRKLHELVCGGVFLIGEAPERMAGRDGDPAEFERLKADIWQRGRSNVYTGSIAEGMKRSGIAPDFRSSADGVRFVHRVDGDRHIYWVRNFSGKEVDADIVLRDARGKLIVLDPVSGKPLYGALRDGRLHLGPDDALFLVTDPAAAAVMELQPLQPVDEIALAGPWTVSFAGMDAPEGTWSIKYLQPLNESQEPAIKYFSGTATYTNTFTLPRKSLPAGLSIDLGEVGQMADVFVNGEHAGFLWKAPYKLTFTGTLKPGKNTIEVRVVNPWVNRLIGDAQPGAEGHSFSPVPFYNADSPLLPSGLIGPVRLETLR